MAQRCPAAKPLGRIILPDWNLVFRGVADCVPEPGAVCYGGVWRITPDCERALDRYEGVRNGAYRKEYVPVTGDVEGEALIYVMNSTGIFPPSAKGLRVIQEGYRDFRMPQNAYRLLDEAVQAAWGNKAQSPPLRPSRR